MASNSTFNLFSSSDDKTDSKWGLGLGFFDTTQPPPLPPPPSSIEVLPSEASDNVKYTVEEVNLDGVTLFKGRVSTQDVFALSNSDLVPGKYEGGLKLWEGSLDLVRALHSEIQKGNISFMGKRVLELGCGHGLPAIFACLEGAATVHFQDFNAEVLRCLTIPNVNENMKKFQNSEGESKERDIRFFAGDWSKIHSLLPYVQDGEDDPQNNRAHNLGITGYEVILMAETVYSISTLKCLYELIKKGISYPNGVVYVAAKKHYFGVGGGTRQFLSIVEKDGTLEGHLVAEVADGSSNVREVWKLSFKEETKMCHRF